MKELYFKCTLKSDIIISQHSATEGVHKCLDYIPGSAFLGVAAAQLYKETSPENFLIFHSGAVSFGDANPVIELDRAFRTPSSWYTKKGEEVSAGVWIHHHLPLHTENTGIQLKQCREGFIYQNNKAEFFELKVDHHTSLKSAYDSEKRRSEDEQMFTYESIKQGLILGFSLRIDETMISTEIEKRIVDALVGDKRVGRSSTAQFGLVKIEVIPSPFNPIATNASNQTIIYADSRLVFIDAQGSYTCTPKHIEDHEVDYERSQIRTFRYSPYNHHRKTYDAERWGIEKGSVIVLKSAAEEAQRWQTNGLGLYRTEGFGRVMINPHFLHTKNTQGRAEFSFPSQEKKTEDQQKSKQPPALIPTGSKADRLLIEHVKQLKKTDSESIVIFNRVNEYVEKHQKHFNKETYASQWGSIRAIAMKANNLECLNLELFREPKTESYNHNDSDTGKFVKKKERIIDHGGYLKHGVAQEKWERKHIDPLCEFMKDPTLSESAVIQSLVNLAAEMAKICKK